MEDDEEAARWSSPLPDGPDRAHLPRRLSISTTPGTVMGSPLASSDDLRRLASSSLISEMGVEQHFAFLAEAVGREACRPTSRTTVVLRDVNYKVRSGILWIEAEGPCVLCMDPLWVLPAILNRMQTPPIPQICVGVKTTAFPTVYESVADPIKGLLQGRRRKRAVTALNRVSAVLEPNKLYLVLGGPKSGKTSLLKTIAGASIAVSRVGSVGQAGRCYGALTYANRSCIPSMYTPGRIRKSRRCVDFTGEVTYNGSTADQGAFDLTSLA